MIIQGRYICASFGQPFSFWEYNITVAVTLYILFAIILIPFIVVIIRAIVRAINGTKKPKVGLRANIAKPPEETGEAYFGKTDGSPDGNSGCAPEDDFSSKTSENRLHDEYEDDLEEDEDDFYDDADDDDFYDDET